MFLKSLDELYLCLGKFHLFDDFGSVDFLHLLLAEADSELEGFVFSVFPNGETCAFLHSGLWAPANGVAFVYGAVRALLGRAANSEDSRVVARIAVDDASGSWLLRDFVQLNVKFVTIFASECLSFTFSARF